MSAPGQGSGGSHHLAKGAPCEFPVLPNRHQGLFPAIGARCDPGGGLRPDPALRPETALVNAVTMAHAAGFDPAAAMSFRTRGQSPTPSAPPPDRLPHLGE